MLLYIRFIQSKLEISYVSDVLLTFISLHSSELTFSDGSPYELPSDEDNDTSDQEDVPCVRMSTGMRSVILSSDDNNTIDNNNTDACPADDTNDNVDDSTLDFGATTPTGSPIIFGGPVDNTPAYYPSDSAPSYPLDSAVSSETNGIAQAQDDSRDTEIHRNYLLNTRINPNYIPDYIRPRCNVCLTDTHALVYNASCGHSIGCENCPMFPRHKCPLCRALITFTYTK